VIKAVYRPPYQQKTTQMKTASGHLMLQQQHLQNGLATMSAQEWTRLHGQWVT